MQPSTLGPSGLSLNFPVFEVTLLAPAKEKKNNPINMSAPMAVIPDAKHICIQACLGS